MFKYSIVTPHSKASVNQFVLPWILVQPNLGSLQQQSFLLPTKSKFSTCYSSSLNFPKKESKSASIYSPERTISSSSSIFKGWRAFFFYSLVHSCLYYTFCLIHYELNPFWHVFLCLLTNLKNIVHSNQLLVFLPDFVFPLQL